jgi:hypothetical protein
MRNRQEGCTCTYTTKTVEGRKSKKIKNDIYAFIFKLHEAEDVPHYSTSRH